MDTCICMDGSLQCLPEIITALLISCACMLNCFSHVWLFATLQIVACQAPLSRRFSRQEYWSGLPCPPPGDLPNPEIEPMSLTSPALIGGFFTIHSTWEALNWLSVQFSSVTQLCPTFFHPMDCSTPVLHHLLELAQTHVHWVSDAIQLSHLLSSPSPPALNLSQH